MSAQAEPRTDSAAVADARALTLTLIGDQGVGAIKRERIGEAVDAALSALRAMGRPVAVDPTLLVREVESLVNVFVGRGTSLDDATDHVPWLPTRRGEIDWRFWDRYRRYLREIKGFPPSSINRLGEITDDVLGRLEDPLRPGPWDRRGMVVGQVQSGKTANYTGLICKAADAGYKLIVVLAGIHNSLRSQTQLRLDEGFLGFDTQQRRFFDEGNRRIGVGRLAGEQRLLTVSSLTNSEERGDFNLGVARQVAMQIGSDPVLLVVKKNASILRNLIRWATELHQHEHPDTGLMVVPDVPILVIDDEADHASVNTNEVTYDENGRPDDETDPTRINQLIRDLIHRFEQSAYVGYTATPFANIFSYAGEPSTKFGEDLFPRSFIVRLPPPSDHIGPAEVFGVAPDAAAELDARPGLPILRTVDDSENWLGTGHKKDRVPGSVPDSLREAIRAFLLACAARRVRGQVNVHNSMLVHVTRFVAVQEQVAEQISEEIVHLRDRLRYGDGSSPDRLIDQLRDLWERDFVPTSAHFEDEALTQVTWSAVSEELAAAVSRIEVLRINGSARDALTYYEHPDGVSIIAVGGDKLSRGLTLEGLSVSYFLRASRMYDTLMQMGRWFGYRPGYLDLCRLYSTRELLDWYRDITAANEELLLLFDEMAAVGGTPSDFGLRVRKSSDGLLITARAKMRHGREMRLSFDNSMVETIAFHTDADVQRRNLELVERFLGRESSAGHGPERAPSRASGGRLVWRGVPGSDVADLLDDFTTHEAARKAQGALLARYIRSCVTRGELLEWTVGLMSGRAGGVPANIAGHDLTLVQRAALSDASDERVYRVRRIVSPSDELIDLPEDAVTRALERTREMWKANPPSGRRKGDPEVPSGPAIRRERPRGRGLLLLYPLSPGEAYGDGDPRRFPERFPPIVGFGVSFPRSDTAPTIDYVVTNTYWQLEMGLMDAA
ncbi:MAG TPA: Z1 domain-containing protein [Thermoleophilaceae bacterium]|nr:Z1 domain-containing protein [Thermoleophilaceae bacterium]